MQDPHSLIKNKSYKTIGVWEIDKLDELDNLDNDKIYNNARVATTHALKKIISFVIQTQSAREEVEIIYIGQKK